MSATLKVGSILAMLLLSASTFGATPRISSATACARLKNRVAQLNSAAHGLNEYRCELTKEGKHGPGRPYYVIALYSNFPAPPGAGPDWIGSSIVGWYAVSRSTGKLYRWDVGAIAIEGTL